MPKFFADIILPFVLEKNYTYEVPEEMIGVVKSGMRAEVPFKNKVYTGIISKIHENNPIGYSVKPILSLPDHLHVVNGIQLELWNWISDYYLCTIGEVMQAALPAAYKLSSETILVLADESKIDIVSLNDKEFIVAEALTIKKEITLFEIQKILHQKSVQNVVKGLIEKRIAFVKETLKDGFKPKVEKFVRLHSEINDTSKLETVFNELEKQSQKQLDLLMIFYQMVGDHKSVKKSSLLNQAKTSVSVLQSLIKKNILIEYDEIVSRLNEQSTFSNEKIIFSEQQEKSFHQIQDKFQDHSVVLLHGITGSGKTEIYIECIKESLKKNKQVLYLLPEIALTGQIVNRLKKHFGNLLGVYHSKFNQNERIEIWQKVLNDSYKIILGARSAVFLPFNQLDLVIVDEEHDYSFKQQDPNPRYHGRDVAIYLAHLHKSKTILGTATPSLETFFHVQKNKYGYVKLNERYSKIELPEIQIVPIVQEKNKTEIHFTKLMIDAIKETLINKEQVIIFQNRRGYAPFILCQVCGWVPSCIRCDVKLVYHKEKDVLKCHYCGYNQKSITVCPACNSTRLLIQGIGTEKIEDELHLLFPENQIARLDLDSVKTKNGFENIIQKFEEGQIDILVGTQMVTKGLDFDHVHVVGIISADQLLNYADFRANERAFQMMVQVSGRAGRKNKKGKVIIQSVYIKHPILQFVVDHDYQKMFDHEIIQRQQFDYPPYTRLIKITVKHTDTKVVSYAAHALAKNLTLSIGNKLFGPTVPHIARLKNKYQLEIMIKVENNNQKIIKVKRYIKSAISELNKQKEFRKAEIVLDVDPL